MKIEIHISEDRRGLSMSVDGGEPMPLDNVILLTNVLELVAEDIHDIRERRITASGDTIRRLM